MNNFIKGYAEDAGTDILLNQFIKLEPGETKCIDLGVCATPTANEMAFLVARTSAAAQGLYVAQCPIDANYTGNITAIVTNMSNKVITYDAGSAFCQIVFVPVIYKNLHSICKKQGKRSDGKMGSTGR